MGFLRGKPLKRIMGRSPIILLFGGTTEGREVAASGLPVIYSVATDYGAELAGFPNAEPLVGRMNAVEMAAFMKSNPVAGVIDATHPYAVEVTKNIRAACAESGVPYLRVLREASRTEGVTSVSSCEEAASFLRNHLPDVHGNALLTVGGKELGKFAVLPAPLKRRLYARVLPSSLVIASCEKLGFDAGHIIAMKGPFTKAMNAATLEMTAARVIVTKDGGGAGGMEEKLSAARELGVEVLLIRRPEKETGVAAEEAIDWGFGLLGLEKLQIERRDGASPRTPLKGLEPFRIPLFPFFTDIAGRRVVVVGGGKVAVRRVRTLLTCGACVTVVSPSFDPAFDSFGNAERLARRYQKGDLKDAALAVAATDDRNVNREAGAEARELGIPVSVADAPEECSFFFPSLVTREGIVAAISTGGRSPSLCRRLAGRLRAVWSDWINEEIS